MLADPTVPAARVVPGWSLVAVVEEVGGHDPLEAVGVGQVEGAGQLVDVVVLVGEGAARTLVVVVVHEGQGVEAVEEAL